MLLADLNQQAAAARTTWRIASARLSRALRLYPGSVVIPLEPSCLQVTLILPQYGLDGLVSCGLLNRPELASQKATVQATLELLRQEKLRPLLPSVVLEGSGPDGTYTGGVFGGGRGGGLGAASGRANVNLGLVWSVQNLGLGNKALVRGRVADKEKALVELFEIQDRVAEEVVQAQAAVEGARSEIPQAETAVREATITFAGTLQGLTQVRGAGNLLQTVSRPQEGVAALQQLNQAYGHTSSRSTATTGQSFSFTTPSVIRRGSLPTRGRWARFRRWERCRPPRTLHVFPILAGDKRSRGAKDRSLEEPRQNEHRLHLANFIRQAGGIEIEDQLVPLRLGNLSEMDR